MTADDGEIRAAFQRQQKDLDSLNRKLQGEIEMTAEQHDANYKKLAEEFAKMDPTKAGYAEAELALGRALQAKWVAGNAHEVPKEK